MQSLEKKSKIFVMSTTRSASNGAKSSKKIKFASLSAFITKNQDKDNFLETPCSKVNDLLCTTEDILCNSVVNSLQYNTVKVHDLCKNTNAMNDILFIFSEI